MIKINRALEENSFLMLKWTKSSILSLKLYKEMFHLGASILVVAQNA